MQISEREKSLWIELIISLAVSVYYFSHVIEVDGFMDVTNVAFGKIITNTILFSITASIILSIFFRHKDNEKKDERDISIKTRGSVFAEYTLKGILILMIGHIMINEGIGYFTSDNVVEINGSFMMHMIVIAILAADSVKSLSQIFFYRRGY
ncbi:MAG: hypothetical protein P8J14_04035 [Emcibacteraceae bacterium]|nr:hypothetical protein [Emcibacteraceae bacterium]